MFHSPYNLFLGHLGPKSPIWGYVKKFWIGWLQDNFTQSTFSIQNVHYLIFISFPGMAFCWGPPKGSYIGKVISWSIFNLSHPLEAVCMYLLSYFQLAFYYMFSYPFFFLFAAPELHLIISNPPLAFSIWQIAGKVNSFLVFFFKFSIVDSFT